MKPITSVGGTYCFQLPDVLFGEVPVEERKMFAKVLTEWIEKLRIDGYEIFVIEPISFMGWARKIRRKKSGEEK